MSPLTGLSSPNWLKIEPHSGEMFIEREFHTLANPFRGGMLADTKKCPVASLFIDLIRAASVPQGAPQRCPGLPDDDCELVNSVCIDRHDGLPFQREPHPPMVMKTINSRS